MGTTMNNSGWFAVVDRVPIKRPCSIAMDTVTVLTLDLPDLKILRTRDFDWFPNLMSLQLICVQLRTVEVNAFRFCNRLEHFYLQADVLEFLPESLLSAMPLLDTLTLLVPNLKNFTETHLNQNCNITRFRLFITCHLKCSFSNMKKVRKLQISTRDCHDFDNYVSFGSDLTVLNFHNIYLNMYSLMCLASLRKLRITSGQYEQKHFNRILNSLSLRVLCVSKNRKFIALNFKADRASNLLEMHLTGNQLTILDNCFFVNCSHLRLLSARANHLKKLNNRLFVGAAHLRYLDLSNNRVSLIKKRAFAGLDQLRMLNLSGNRLDNKLTVNCSLLRHLQFLNLARNTLRKLVTDTLFESIASCDSLTVFDCSSNRIEFVDRDFFAALPNLQYLKMARNLQKSLKTNRFPFSCRLVHCDFRSNLLREIQRIPSTFIAVLNLSQNAIDVVPCDMFVRSVFLRRLDLSANRLKSLPDGLFADNERLSVVLLNCNRLVSIPADLFAYTPQLSHVDLSGGLNSFRKCSSNIFLRLNPKLEFANGFGVVIDRHLKMFLVNNGFPFGCVIGV